MHIRPYFHQHLLILSGMLLSLVLMGSCSRDKCKRVQCVHGQCVEGDCLCETGYEGDLCGNVMNEKFQGTFLADESCTAGFDTYDVYIQRDSDVLNRFVLVGVWESYQDTLEAVIGSDGLSFEVSRQPLAGYEVSAEGIMNFFHDEISLSYRVYETGVAQAFDVCTAQLELQ